MEVLVVVVSSLKIVRICCKVSAVLGSVGSSPKNVAKSASFIASKSALLKVSREVFVPVVSVEEVAGSLVVKEDVSVVVGRVVVSAGVVEVVSTTG